MAEKFSDKTEVMEFSDELFAEKLPTPAPFTSLALDPFARQVLNNNIYLIATDLMQDVEAADAGSYGNFFVSDSSWRIISITEVHRVTAGGGTVQIEKLTSGTAKGSGNNLLVTAFSLTASANVPRFGTLTATKDDLILRRGDRLGSKTATLSGTPEDVCITIILKKI